MADRSCGYCGASIEHLIAAARYCSPSHRNMASRNRVGADRAQRGYIEWSPKPESRVLVEHVEAVLEEYRHHLPLTLRQIFYRLVGAYGFEKSERGYNNLKEKLIRARRARLIPFNALRDDGVVEYVGPAYTDREEFEAETLERAQGFRLDRQLYQDVYIEVWCEAAGMVPQLFEVAAPYSVPVFSSGGQVSLSTIRGLVDRAGQRMVPTLILHVGDYDPSGEQIFQHLIEDTVAFLADDYPEAELEGKRVAITPAQIAEFALPAAPPKESDKKTRGWLAEGRGDTVQAEALPPDTLATIVRNAIESHVDDRVRVDVLERERVLREGLIEEATS